MNIIYTLPVRRLNTILKTELDQAVEKSKLSMGLCAQVGGYP